MKSTENKTATAKSVRDALSNMGTAGSRLQTKRDNYDSTWDAVTFREPTNSKASKQRAVDELNMTSKAYAKKYGK